MRKEWLLKSRWLVLTLLVMILLAVGLAWSSSNFSDLDGWFSFLVVLVLVGAFVWLVWKSVRHEKPPNWLLGLIIISAVLRLILGVFWYLGMPEWGYENEVQQGGYVMRDAYERDTDAWEMAQSDQPLITAFQGSAYDQYGGLLYLSASIYRYSGVNVHQPLLIVVITATISALAVLYCWLFSRRLWGEKTAILAALFLAFYPEAMLLGSSQMREAITITFAVMLVYYLHCFWQDITWRYLMAVGGIILLSAALSFPFAGWIVLMAVLLSLVMGKESLDSWKPSWTVIIVILLILAAVVFYQTNRTWIVEVGHYQTYLTERSSGHIQKLFDELPEDLHIPFVVTYGVVRPLLPAALTANSGAPIWQGIAIWRSLGWMILLALFTYASFLALKKRNWYKSPGILLLASWIYTFMASYRGGGDEWDNPRYRVAIAGIQIALASWAVVQQREQKDPWLRRFVGVTLIIGFWVFLWYIPRYFAVPWRVGGPLDAAGLGLLSSVLYLVWDWVREADRLTKK